MSDGRCSEPAKNATSTIPIVLASRSDPVGVGFVASLARPGGNITGLSTLSPGIGGKRLELLKEIVPKLSRAAVLRNSTIVAAQELKENLDPAQVLLGIASIHRRARSKEFESAFREAGKGQANGVRDVVRAVGPSAETNCRTRVKTGSRRYPVL